ncbi:MAG: alpha-mannosidase [Anaerolineae bacterium]|nr:alpha-mannosidase [Anaerolineae bacterium]
MVFTIEKIERQLPEIRAAIYREAQPVPRFRMIQYPTTPPPEGIETAHHPDFDDSAWTDFAVGQTWGGYDITAWFRAVVTVPETWRQAKVALHFLVGPRDGGKSTAETLLYVNGAPLQGIDIWHEEAVLPPAAVARGQLALALKAWSGVFAPPPQRHFKLAELVRIDEATEQFYAVADTVLKSAKELDPNDLRRLRLLEALDGAFHVIDFAYPRSNAFYSSISEASQVLQKALAALGQSDALKPTITVVGHSHIDLAWLWQMDATIEKASRTFATVLNLMRQYPEYCYMHSTPQLFKLLEERYPELYAAIKARVDEGRFEVTGAMWVEADTNLPGGESLVRQLLLGKETIERHLGQRTTVLWMPDVFGYSAVLPQLMHRSGISSFMTIKLSWNQFNRFPYDTFRWRGIDGTEVLAHFGTTPAPGERSFTYIGQLTPFDVKGTWDHYQQKALNDELLLSFGWGDGGGGPTREMLKTARVLANLPGMPRVQMGKVESYFERLKQRVGGKSLPVWDGELYLELHRGTYTSQGFIKRANRKAEVLYHDAEALSALADIVTGAAAYPQAELRQGWEHLLRNQFHDILPGSSIHAVYEDCRKDYAWIFSLGEAAIRRAQERLCAQIPTSGPALVVFNTLGQQRDDVATLEADSVFEGKAILSPQGEALPLQQVEEDGKALLLVDIPAAPALGYCIYPLADARATPAPTVELLDITPEKLENAFYRLTLNAQGQIASLFDKVNTREVLAPDAPGTLSVPGNVLQIFEDKPLTGDAWEIDPYYEEKQREVTELLEAIVEETGPVRGSLRLCWRYGKSLITQRLSFYARHPRIDFRTKVIWRERQTLLKVAFPVNVRATRATYDIQFGNLERPTHHNTSWDAARFEVPAHKWVDLSEGNYGVALLNDCKYGHDVHDNILRLTLIKSPIYPDPEADLGEHCFTYSLLPHAGDWRASAVIPQGYALNAPLHATIIPHAQPGNLPPTMALATLDTDHVILETLKKAEYEDSLSTTAWIVRVYETRQFRNPAVRLRFGLPIHRAVECNLMEEQETPVIIKGDTLTFAIKPYEIKTFMVWM